MPDFLRRLADAPATDRVAAVLIGAAVAIYMLAVLSVVLHALRKADGRNSGEGER